MPELTPVILGIAGGTGSGKTTVARAILDAVGYERIAFLPLDSYYRDIDWHGGGQHGGGQVLQHNFDHPDALDFELYVEHLQTLKQGRGVEVPVYDFVHHQRSSETRSTAPRAVILAEGILLLAEPRVRQLLDFKVYVDTDADVRLARRISRDLDERGRQVGDILRQYMETVRPMHLEFVEPSKRYADVIVPEGGENRVAMGMVTARIEQLLGPPLL